SAGGAQHTTATGGGGPDGGPSACAAVVITSAAAAAASARMCMSALQPRGARYCTTGDSRARTTAARRLSTPALHLGHRFGETNRAATAMERAACVVTGRFLACLGAWASVAPPATSRCG